MCGLTFEFRAVIEILFNFFDLLQLSFLLKSMSAIYNGAERAGIVVGRNGAGEDISGVYMMMNSPLRTKTWLTLCKKSSL